MRFALKGVENKGMKAPAGIVNSGGEYYMKERMTTSSDITLDNSGTVPRPAQQPSRQQRPANANTAATPDSNRDGGDRGRGDLQETPVQPSNVNNRQLDSLF